MFVLMVFHDPIIHKLLLSFTDLVVKSISSDEEDSSGNLDQSQIENECLIEHIRSLIDKIRKFRLESMIDDKQEQ
jgi:hypothetical protein